MAVDRIREKRPEDLTKDKTKKEKYHVRFVVCEVFGFVEHQQIAANGLGKNLTLTRNIDIVLLNRAAGITNAKRLSIVIIWYVLNYTPNMEQLGLLSVIV